MSEERPSKTHRFLSAFVDWKKVATTLLLGGVTIIYTGAGWVWQQFNTHETYIQDLKQELQTYRAHVLPEQQELVRRNLALEQQLQDLLLEYRMLRYQVEWQHRATGSVPTDPEAPLPATAQPLPNFDDWLKRYRDLTGNRTISPDDIRRFREQAQQLPQLPYEGAKK